MIKVSIVDGLFDEDSNQLDIVDILRLSKFRTYIFKLNRFLCQIKFIKYDSTSSIPENATIPLEIYFLNTKVAFNLPMNVLEVVRPKQFKPKLLFVENSEKISPLCFNTLQGIMFLIIGYLLLGDLLFALSFDVWQSIAQTYIFPYLSTFDTKVVKDLVDFRALNWD